MYNVITDKDRSAGLLPRNSNTVNYSLFKELYCAVPFRSFAIKYVVDGYEKYTVNGQAYHLGPRTYLLANEHAEGWVDIASPQPVKGICVDVATHLLSEAVGSYCRPDTPFPDQALDIFFSTPHFLENQYKAPLTQVGQLLMRLEDTLAKDPFRQHHFTPDFYFNLAECLVADHRPIFKQLQTVPAVKASTRKDLWKRVNVGKELIETQFANPIDMAEVARESQLSAYHFYRLFRAIHGISPYQYLIKTRLNWAATQIRTQRMPLSEIAEQAGFADIHSFSKSFKQHFGLSPSVYR